MPFAPSRLLTRRALRSFPPLDYAPPGPGLLGWWPLWDGSHPMDCTGNNLTGAPGAGTPLVAPGPFTSPGMKLDGTTAYLDMGGASLLGVPAVTAMCWINFSSLAHAYSACLSKVPSGGLNAYQLFVKSTGKLAVYFVNASTNVNYDGTGINSLLTGRWYHLAMTYNSTVGGVGYVNGVKDGTTTNAIGAIGISAAHFTVGTDTNTAGRQAAATFADVRVYNRALSASEVFSIYTASLIDAAGYGGVVGSSPPTTSGIFTVSGHNIIDLFGTATTISYPWSPTQRRTN